MGNEGYVFQAQGYVCKEQGASCSFSNTGRGGSNARLNRKAHAAESHASTAVPSHTDSTPTPSNQCVQYARYRTAAACAWPRGRSDRRTHAGSRDRPSALRPLLGMVPSEGAVAEPERVHHLERQGHKPDGRTNHAIQHCDKRNNNSTIVMDLSELGP